MTHRFELRPRFAELDPYDHVNHAVYVTWFEEGRIRALEAAGAGLAEMKASGYQLVVTQVELRYRRAVGATDIVAIETSISDRGRASVTWHQVASVDGSVCVEASVRAGITDSSGRPTRPPPGLLDRLADLASGAGLRPEPGRDR